MLDQERRGRLIHCVLLDSKEWRGVHARATFSELEEFVEGPMSDEVRRELLKELAEAGEVGSEKVCSECSGEPRSCQ